MSKLAKKYDGPKLHIIVERADIGGNIQYKWRITMVDSDWRRAGARKLAYRASGFIAGDKVGFESEPQVHDENRDVWTTMNLTDRPDIRKTIRSKVLFAQKKLEESGEDGFDFRLD